MSNNKKVLEVEMLCSAMKSLCEAIDLLTEKRIGMEIKLEQLESKVECLEDKLKQVDWYIRSSDDDNFKLAERILRLERKLTRFMKTKL